MQNHRGIISMITTIMISILLITMAIGLIALLSGSLQQASDNELSLRAEAAAEGGVEWAIAWMIAHPGYTNTNCATTPAGVATFSGFGGVPPNKITCLLVNNTTNHPNGTLDANTASQITVAAGSGLKSIRLSWINNGTQPSANFPIGPLPGSWFWPAMELTIVNYTVGGGNINPGTIRIQNVLAVPNLSAGGGGNKILGNCGTAAGGYACNATFAVNPPVNGNEGTIVSLRAKYLNGTTQNVGYQIQFLDSSGNPINVPGQFATIDVTARAGSVYRRIIAQAPIGSNAVPANLNYVLFGDQNICKQFSLYKNGANYIFQPGLCPLP